MAGDAPAVALRWCSHEELYHMYVSCWIRYMILASLKAATHIVASVLRQTAAF